MQIGKSVPNGAFYTIPEANERFAGSEDISNLNDAVDNLEEQTELLSDSVSGVADAVRELDEMIPTPTAADEGKVLTANDQGGYELETASGGLKNLVDGIANGSVRSIDSKPDSGTTKLGLDSVCFGSSTSAHGSYSLVSGFLNNVNGSASTVFGKNNTTNSESSLVCGEGMNLEDKCQNSIVCGIGNENNTANSIVLGKFCSNSLQESNIFVIGNGINVRDRRNLFVITLNGSLIFSNGTEITPTQFAQLYQIANSTPTTDGTYNLQVTVTNGEPAYSWIAV